MEQDKEVFMTKEELEKLRDLLYSFYPGLKPLEAYKKARDSKNEDWVDFWMMIGNKLSKLHGNYNTD